MNQIATCAASSSLSVTEISEISPPNNRLNRLAWHKPLISVVITHFNYSHHIRDALLSLLDQTHENWECVVVDDASSEEHKHRLASIIEELDHPKIQLLSMRENSGQIHAFFYALDKVFGEFVCLLDPDDRYTDSFLEEALVCHLNQVVYCPIVCTEQMLLGKDGLITGVYSWHNRARAPNHHGKLVVKDMKPQLLYYERSRRGWFWTSTSAMMFRRSALQLLRPQKRLAYKGSFDSYVAQGVHLLGGTLFYTKPLVYRGLHAHNAWITENVYASTQDKKKTYGEERSAECLADVLQAIKANGISLPSGPSPIKKRGLLAKWQRSLNKRIYKKNS